MAAFAGKHWNAIAEERGSRSMIQHLSYQTWLNYPMIEAIMAREIFHKILFMKSKLPSFHFVYLLEIQQNHHAEYTGPSYMDANPLQMVQRYFEGKNIEQLNITQLIQLERELDSTLVYTRGRKTEAMMKSVTALHQKYVVFMEMRTFSRRCERQRNGVEEAGRDSCCRENRWGEQDLTDENNLIEREICTDQLASLYHENQISAIINNGNLAGQHGRVVEDPDCVHPSPLDLFHF
ncbi:hypothetical protein NC653_003440 [Populus alba x Populus x berolinensis]|uniref:K-box domain-containing protein n=1 Tax=Populus alba x Populus x berolinensis TaxID=444605 RepID=A0AAD6RRG9_9ROSI|nr:hypothetical protein NC653_003440 [Populus alba x Populus x berolinensis]